MATAKKISLDPHTDAETAAFDIEKSEAQNLFGYMINPYCPNAEMKRNFGYRDSDTGEIRIKYISAIGIDKIRRNDCVNHIVNWRELYTREGYGYDKVVELCNQEYRRRMSQQKTYRRWKNQEGTEYDEITYTLWKPEYAIQGLGLKFVSGERKAS